MPKYLKTAKDAWKLRKDNNKASNTSMNAIEVMTKAWKKLDAPPLSHRDRNKARFFDAHLHKLPQNVLDLLSESGRLERNSLINHIVVKGSDRKWCFKLDVLYLQESLRAEFVRWSPMSAWACMHWHRWTQNHSNPPSHKTTGIVPAT